MATLTPTIIQGGSLDAAGTAWLPGFPQNLGRPPGDLSEAWVQLDFTQASTTALTAGTYTLNTFAGFFGFNYTFDLIIPKYTLTQDFSNSYLPTQLPRLVVPDFFQVNFSATANPITLALHSSAGAATALMSALRTRRTADSNGVIRLGVGFRVSANSATSPFSVNAPLVTFEGEPEFTGLQGPYQAWGRADECPKCGGKSTRDTWLRDGYTGMMVCPHCYDEPDLVGRSYQGLGSEREGSGEG